ncbi:MAG: polynucleotide adenylyltransferase PcnB [Fibrobacterota bacterium]
MLNWLKNFTKRIKQPRRLRDAAILPSQIDPDARKVLHRLAQNGHAAYIVGGAVRDLVLGLTPKDFDVATAASPNEIRRLFRNALIIGRRFRLAHIRFSRDKVIETATFRRHHGQTGAGVVEQDNVFGTESEDAFRRDFTMNALFYDVATGEIIDYTGGYADLKKKVIRCIGDPRERLAEDPVRMLRALKFSTMLGLSLEPGLAKSIRRLREKIVECSPRRLFEEFLKIIKSGTLALFVKEAERFDLLRHYQPYLHKLYSAHPDLYRRLFEASDRAIRAEREDVTFGYALIVWPIVKKTLASHQDPQQALHHAFEEFQRAFPISRAEKMRMRGILLLQPRFIYLRNVTGKKRPLVRKFIRYYDFPEALRLHRVLEMVEKGTDESYRYWKELAERPAPPPPPPRPQPLPRPPKPAESNTPDDAPEAPTHFS